MYISVAVASESELFDYNGWIPVSNDIVYNQIRRGITQVPRFTKADTQILNNNLTSQHQDEGVGTERDHFESNIDEDHNKGKNTIIDELTLWFNWDKHLKVPSKVDSVTALKFA